MKARLITLSVTVVALAAMVIPVAQAGTVQPNPRTWSNPTTVVPNPRGYSVVSPNPRVSFGTIVPNPRIRFGIVVPNPRFWSGTTVTPNPSVRYGVVLPNPRINW